MRKFALLLTCLLLMGIHVVFAQSRTITGTVTDVDDGTTLPGVSVVVKGTSIGTVTDIDGKFSLNVPSDAKVLRLSFIGFETKEITLTTANNYAVVFEKATFNVDEVVVTALGIAREKKSLGYAVQEVSGESVSKVKSDNFITSMSGKVAGVQVKNNTNFGGSTNIIIRGSSSLTGSNQALFVVDGIPVDNSNTNNSGQLTGRNGYDYGNSAADINPNDIESISILKGAAATALYGSRAANGVILVTTKKGNAAAGLAPVVKVSANVTFNKIDKSTFPTYQKESGAGYGKYYYSGGDYPGFEDYADVNGDGEADYTVPFYEDASRGQAFDPNVLVYQWDALDPESPNYMKKTPWVAGANDPTTFFETGFSNTENIEISGGDKKTTYRFSYNYFDSKGVMPNSKLNKNSVMFAGSQMISKNLKISTSANYIINKGLGRPSTGYSDNIMSSFRQWYQTNVDLGAQKAMYEKTGRNVTWNPAGYDNLAPAYWDNPYWVRYENYEKDQRNRLIGYVQLDWDITKDLKAMGRYAIDSYNELQEEHKAVGSGSGEFGVGRNDVTSGYSRFTRDFTESNLDFMLNYHKAISENFDLTALLGTNIRRTSTERVFASTNNGLQIPGLYALSNSVDPMLPPEESLTQVGVNGIFGSVSLGFMNTYFLDATLRRDQSSTLPAANNAYFYPSVSTSILFSNLIDADWLSLGKLRLNYAEVGSSAPALSLKDTYVLNAPFSGTALVTVPNTKNNAELRPERQRALEAGLELSFFDNRLGFDLALYKDNTFDQLIPVSVSFVTGFASTWVNAGEVENKGIELALRGTPVKTDDFKWDINVNWASNKNQVKSLFTDESGNEVTNLQIASLQGGVSINATVGQPYGAIKGSDYQYHENGGKLINPANGRYYKSTTNDVVIGNVNPEWTAGINNSLKYKNLNLSFLVDVSQGGDVFSLDLWYGYATGLYEETAGKNDLGNLKRDAIKWNDTANKTKEGGYAATSGGVIEEGVLADGSANWVRRNNENYGAIGYAADPNARFVFDASYVKLREVTITYDLPKKLVNKLSLTNASIGIVGSNLWIISKNLPHADPEATQSSGNIQGWQSGVMPATRNLGFTINLQF